MYRFARPRDRSEPPEPETPVGASGRRLSLLPYAPALFLLVASLLVAAASMLAPKDPHRLVAIFPVWWSLESSLAAASQVAAVTGLGALPFVVAVAGADDDLETRLRGLGAIAVIDGAHFSFCDPRVKGN